MQKGLGKRVFIKKVVTKIEPLPANSFVTDTKQLEGGEKIDYIIKYIGAGVDNQFLAIGQRVFLGMYTQEPQNVDGEKLLIVKEDDIIAIL